MNENVKISKHFLIWYRTEILICNPKSENQIDLIKFNCFRSSRLIFPSQNFQFDFNFNIVEQRQSVEIERRQKFSPEFLICQEESLIGTCWFDQIETD